MAADYSHDQCLYCPDGLHQLDCTNTIEPMLFLCQKLMRPNVNSSNREVAALWRFD